MSNEDYTLAGFFVTVFVDDSREEGSEGIDVIGLRVLWRKFGKTAAWKIDGQTRGQIDETATKPVDENK
ncbi:hypothetical protein SLS58_000165 [Diplodia intermedia]|uniref:Uncharacterized protein n=1 Tax=Diplodia intermedia TaxID=856260 RepID=A0ABR3U6J4_9PEZI